MLSICVLCVIPRQKQEVDIRGTERQALVFLPLHSEMVFGQSYGRTGVLQEGTFSIVTDLCLDNFS